MVSEQERNFDSGYPVTTRPLRVYGEEVIDVKPLPAEVSELFVVIRTDDPAGETRFVDRGEK